MTHCKYSSLFYLSLLWISLNICITNSIWATWGGNRSIATDLPTDGATAETSQSHRQIDFLIQDVKVDVTATSSQLARNQAISEAQHQALKKLIENIAPGFDENKFTSLQEHEIEFMVQDFEITHEKISNVRYAATFTIRFNPIAVKQFLKRTGGQNLINMNNLAAAQINTSPISKINNWLIVPAFKNNGHKLLWEEDNHWYQQWEQYDFDKSSALKLTLPIRDLDDFNTLSAQDAFDGNTVKLDLLLKRYDINHALVATLELSSENAILHLQQYKLNDVKVLSQTIVVNIANLTEPQILHEALKKTLSELSNIDNHNTVPKKTTKLTIQCEFTTYNDWLKIRKALDAMPLIQPLMVKALNRDRAEVQISIQCDLQELIDNLIYHNYKITKIKPQRYKLIKIEGLQTNFSNLSSAILPVPIRRYIPQRSKPYYKPAEIR